MKKLIFTTALSSMLTIISCTSENSVVSTAESLKTTEMKNFDKAFRSLGEPQNKPTEEEKRSGSAELSDRRKKILMPASVALIKSTGISDEVLLNNTKGDMTATIVWATKINLEKNAGIKNQLKFEN